MSGGARSTLSTRRVAALGVGLTLVLVVSVVALDALGWPRAEAGTPAIQAEAGPAEPDPTASESAQDPVSQDADGIEADAVDADDADREEPEHEPEPEPVPTTADEEVDGQQVAADFAAAFATYRYDDGPEAARDRVGAFVTADLAAALDGSGGAAGLAELAAREEVAVAQVDAVQPQFLGDGRMDLLVVVRQEVTTVDGATTRYLSYLTRVERTEAGWLVTGFQP